MEQVEIRKATIADLDTLLGFEQAVVEAERPFDVTLKGEGVRYYDLEKLIASPDAEIVVALFDAEIIGSGYARIEMSKPYLRHTSHAYLGFMYVVPEHRGKGVNKKIIEVLGQWALSQNVTEMRLQVYAGNIAAIKAYEKSDFTGHMLEMRCELRDGAK